MAAGVFTLYNHVAELIGDGTIDLDTHSFKLALFTSSYTPAGTHTTLAGITANQVAAGNGYTANGAALTSVTWNRSAGVATFDSADVVWTASGGPITARYAVMFDDTAASDELIGYVLLDTTPADVTATDGNTLTVAPSASGWFAQTVNPA